MADLTISTKLMRGDSQWIFVLPADTVVHDGRRIRNITRSQIETYMRNTKAMYEEYNRLARGVTPYRLPLLIEHDFTGPSLGKLEDFRVASRGERDGLWVRVDYSKSGRLAVKAQRYRYVSVRIVDSITTQEGKVFGPVIAEVSLTAYPRIQSLGEITDTVGMALAGLIQGKSMKNLLAIMALLQNTELQEELATAIEALQGEEGEGDGEETPPAEEAPAAEEGQAALAASIVKQLEGVIDSKIAPLHKEIERMSKLNLSQKSVGAAPGKKTVILEESHAYKAALARGENPAAARLIASFHKD